MYLGLWCLDGLGLICLWRGIVVAAADLGCFIVGGGWLFIMVYCCLWIGVLVSFRLGFARRGACDFVVYVG